MYDPSERLYTETCALTHVPIQYGDEVVMVQIHPRAITRSNEGDYFRYIEHFRDVESIQAGYFDGYNGLVEDATPLPKKHTWILFFHKSAWELAQKHFQDITSKFYDPPVEDREAVLALHKATEEQDGKKAKLDPIFRPYDFPKGMLEFARVVLLAWNTRRNLVPPATGPDEVPEYAMAYDLTALTLTLLNSARKTSDELAEISFSDTQGVLL